MKNPERKPIHGKSLAGMMYWLANNGDKPKDDDADRMGEGYDSAQVQRMPDRAARADQVGRDDCLAVARFQRVHNAQKQRDRGCDQDELQA